MGDLPVLEWDEGHRETLADVADIGVVKLMAWPTRWRVDWFGDCAAGDAQSRDDARATRKGGGTPGVRGPQGRPALAVR